MNSIKSYKLFKTGGALDVGFIIFEHLALPPVRFSCTYVLRWRICPMTTSWRGLSPFRFESNLCDVNNFTNGIYNCFYLPPV